MGPIDNPDWEEILEGVKTVSPTLRQVDTTVYCTSCIFNTPEAGNVLTYEKPLVSHVLAGSWHVLPFDKELPEHKDLLATGDPVSA